MTASDLSTMFDGPAGGPESGRFDERLPPQDVGAEQSVIGSMLLSKDAIADVVETVRGVDFYRPAHELIYDAIMDLYSRGEPADAITVSDELTKRGDLQRAGGQAYLHDLIQSVPTAANAGFYAQIVAERAVLRRLVDAGTRIVQMGYAQGGGDVEDIVNAAQAEVYQVAETRGGEDYQRLWDTLNQTMAEIEVAAGRSDEMIGVPTGFPDLDDLTHGLHPGQMIVIAARPAIGKALALDTPLPTPTGWTTMGEVAVGDQLIDASGQPTTVVAATEVMTDRPCFEVEFSDGTVIVADAQHQWLTDTRASRRSHQAARDGRNRQKNQRTFAQIRTTEEIAATLRTQTADRRLNHSVVNAQALQLPEADLALAPYVLGAWLGDGSSDGAIITTADPEIVARIEGEGLEVTKTSATMRYSLHLPVTCLAIRTCAVCGTDFVPKTSQVMTCGRSCGGRAKGLDPMPRPACPDCGRVTSGHERCQECHSDHGTVQALLRKLGVLGSKHIPAEYLRASETQRRELLAGLLDTDGTVTQWGCVQFTTTSAELLRGVQDLVAGLGYRYGLARKQVKGRSLDSSVAYTMTFSTDDDVFWLERKALKHKQTRARRFQRRDCRFITDIRPVESVPVRCVEVDNAAHLYLAGRTMIPTHNSTLGIDVARAAAIHHNQATAVFSLEMSRTEITMRILAAEASIPLQNLRRGQMSDPDWTKLSRVMGKISDSPLFIDDSPNLALMEIRAKARRLKQQHNLKLVIIDYLQLMTSGKKVESRQQEVAEFSRALKLLAKELEVPVIAISQLNRGPEQRTDKRPQMSDLRESGCLTADTRLLRADTGAETTLGDLHASGARDVSVWALDDSLRYVKRTMTHVFSTGTAPVFKLTLASGKTVRATENHRFFTYEGWSALANLRAGDRLAVPRHVPSPRALADWTDAEVFVAAHGAVRAEGLVPVEVFSLPKPQIAAFLAEVWALCGGVDVGAAEGRIWCAPVPSSTADAVARLLLRFGIQTRHESEGGDARLVIDGVDSQRRFLQEIGAGPAWSEQSRAVLEIVRSLDRGVDRIDPQVWRDVETAAYERGTPVAAFARSGEGSASAVSTWAESPSRERVGAVADVLDRADLELSAVNDVFWDTVVSVEPDGVEEVFDATVMGHHNFVANGIAAHNSIEQDADLVILLHRDRDPEAQREGEADVIVAKHRNGPTADITLGFQGHYARFTTMAKDSGGSGF